jgi:hypothetical protein
MRRLALLLCCVLALLLVGAHSGRQPVLPESAQSGFEQVMRAVNQQHRLGAAARITDMSIQPRKVRLELELLGKHHSLALVHPGAGDRGLQSRYFAFVYDADEWRGQRAELQRLAGLLDQAFSRTPWVIAGTDLRDTLPRWTTQPIELGRGLALTLVCLSWVLGLAGTGLLLFRRPQR